MNHNATTATNKQTDCGKNGNDVDTIANFIVGFDVIVQPIVEYLTACCMKSCRDNKHVVGG
jgi:hypothetical protein